MKRIFDQVQSHDGFLMKYLVSNFQKPLYKKLLTLINKNCRLLDVGCGTGAFTFMAAGRCSFAAGIDISSVNIKYAEREKQKRGFNNIDFFHADARSLNSIVKETFDYAVISFSLHEMPSEIRIPVIRGAKEAAGIIIIADYTIPVPKSFWGFTVPVTEYLAGREHNFNFLDYKRKGGIEYLIRESGLKVKEKIFDRKGISTIILSE